MDVSPIFVKSGFKIFDSVVAEGGAVRALPVNRGASQAAVVFRPHARIRPVIGSQGLAYLVWGEAEVKGPIAKYLKPAKLDMLKNETVSRSRRRTFFRLQRGEKSERDRRGHPGSAWPKSLT